MQKHNGTWPYYGNNDFLAHDESRVADVENRVRLASRAAACMAPAEIWRSGDGEPLGDMSLAQVFGQLRARTFTPEWCHPCSGRGAATHYGRFAIDTPCDLAALLCRSGNPPRRQGGGLMRRCISAAQAGLLDSKTATTHWEWLAHWRNAIQR